MKTKKNAIVDLEKKRPFFFLIGLVTALSFTLLAFEWRTSEYKVIIPEDDFDDHDEIVDILRPIPRKQKPELPKPKSGEFEIVKDLPSEASKKEAVELIPEIENPYDFMGEEPMEPEPIIPDVGLVDFADVMPIFPGGEAALFKYLANNINYPSRAKDMNITGKVFVSFVVDKKGKISDVQIARGIGYDCDKEAIRVVKNMPIWTPGKQAGKTVSCRYMLPINFVLRN